MNDEFNLPSGSYFTAQIQNYFEYIIKKHETTADNISIQIYVNRIKNRVVFKINAGYKLEILSTKNEEHLPKNGDIKVENMYLN